MNNVINVHSRLPRLLTAVAVVVALFVYGLQLYPLWQHAGLWALVVAGGSALLRLLPSRTRWMTYGTLVALVITYLGVAQDTNWPRPANLTPVLSGLTLAVLLLRDHRPFSRVTHKEQP